MTFTWGERRVIAVVKVGLVLGHGRRRSAGCAARWPLAQPRRPHRGRGHLRCHRGRLGGTRARGAAAVGPGRPAGGLGRRPAPADAAVAGRLRPARAARRARCSWRRSTSSTARSTCTPAGRCGHLVDLGVVPVVNENDAVADEEIRFGDNDRLAALVAHLVGARAARAAHRYARPADGRSPPRRRGVADRRGRRDRPAARAPGRGPGQRAGQRRHGIEAGRGEDRHLVGRARRSSPTPRARACSPPRWPGEAGVGTVFRARESRLSARKLWIAFALGASGRLTVDEGARAALTGRGRSLLAAGVVAVERRLPARRRGGDRRARRRGLRQGPGPAAHAERCRRSGWARAQSRSSSTGTTWSL